MNNKKSILCLSLIIMGLIFKYISMFNIISNDLLLNIIIIILIILSIIIYIFSSNNSENNLFNKIINTSDTSYIIVNSKTKKCIYLSNNIENILGIKKSISIDDTLTSIINIPVIKSELKNWDNKSNYVSSLLEYDNPSYNHSTWIRLKFYNYNIKDEEYFVLEIVESSKEHDRQHFLISQASFIKLREKTLNEIITKTYDFEININLINDTCKLEYYKKDMLYFGNEEIDNYSKLFDNMLNYVNEKDLDKFKSNFSYDNLVEHFNKFEFNSLIFRYRVGNEIKGNSWLESTFFFFTNKCKNTVLILTKNVTDDAESIREQNLLLQNALLESKKINKTKNELISTISHDIRTPLTNIVGISESLMNDNIDKKIIDDIKNINESSCDILKTVDGLLDSTNIESKSLKLEEENYSIYKMFNKIEDNVKEYLENKSIKFNINLDSNLPVILYGNRMRITSSITEVIINSIKNTKDGSIDVIVKGEKIDSNVKLIVTIKDTGKGISEKKINSIMNSTDNTGLNGIKKLMNLLGGSLEIESKEGEFTKVELTFIQKIVEDNKVREMINNNKSAEVIDFSGKKILVVDDNKLNLKVTSRLLEQYKLDITLIESGQECLDIVNEQNKFDLILMDQMMPYMSGTEAMNKLKEIDGFNTPVVVLTADAMKGQKEKYLNSGFDDYISKPIDKLELTRVLKKFLS